MKSKVWIGNLGKYNEGVLMGEWVPLPIDEEAQNELFKRIGLEYYDDAGNLIETGYEEYFIGDYDFESSVHIVDIHYLIYFDPTIKGLNDFAAWLARWERDCKESQQNAEELLAAIIEYTSDVGMILDSKVEDWLLHKDIQSAYDLGRMLVFERDFVNATPNEKHQLTMYFNFESYGEDELCNISGMLTHYGLLEHLD